MVQRGETIFFSGCCSCSPINAANAYVYFVQNRSIRALFLQSSNIWMFSKNKQFVSLEILSILCSVAAFIKPLASFPLTSLKSFWKLRKQGSEDYSQNCCFSFRSSWNNPNSCKLDLIWQDSPIAKGLQIKLVKITISSTTVRIMISLKLAKTHFAGREFWDSLEMINNQDTQVNIHIIIRELVHTIQLQQL